MNIRMITVRKRSGGERVIFAPSHALKTMLRLEVPRLNEIQIRECDPNVVHGFMPGKSAVTNALRHVGFRFTLSADIKDFFDSVKVDKFRNQDGTLTIPHECVVNTHRITNLKKSKSIKTTPAPQGFPTSPAIANLAAVGMDKDLLDICRPRGIVYTRYADDLSFSGNNVVDLAAIRDSLRGILAKHGFQINQRKTRIQDSRFGRRDITGVMVDDNGIHPSREAKRRLRAARHQKRWAHAKGLAEWCSLKTPKPGGSDRMSRVRMAVARHAARRMAGIEDVWR